MKSNLEIEREFDAFFASIQFKRVCEIIGDAPNFNNADYIDLSRKTLVELKILDKDYFYEGGIIDRFCSFVPIPKGINEKGLGLYHLKFPKINREGKIDTFEEPLRRILKKANRQLKETNNNLLAGKGTNLIMFAINRFQSLSPIVIINMICELLEEEFSSVSGFILCTPTINPPSCISASKSSASLESSQCRWEIAEAWGKFFDNGGHA